MVLGAGRGDAGGDQADEDGQHDAGYSVQTAAVLSLVSFAVGVLSHFGLLKPAGISRKAQDSLVKAA